MNTLPLHECTFHINSLGNLVIAYEINTSNQLSLYTEKGTFYKKSLSATLKDYKEFDLDTATKKKRAEALYKQLVDARFRQEHPFNKHEDEIKRDVEKRFPTGYVREFAMKHKVTMHTAYRLINAGEHIAMIRSLEHGSIKHSDGTLVQEADVIWTIYNPQEELLLIINI